MAEERKEGLAAALADAEIGEPPAADDEQGELLPLPMPAVDADGQAVEARRGPGRPRGSRNKRTEAWADYLLGRYGSPLEGLARIAFRPTAELAKELKCKPLAALSMQKACFAELAPYIHGKQPVALDVTKRSIGLLLVGQLTPEQADQVGRLGLDLTLSEDQQIQSLSEDDAAQSDEPQSDEDAK